MELERGKAGRPFLQMADQAGSLQPQPGGHGLAAHLKVQAGVLEHCDPHMGMKRCGKCLQERVLHGRQAFQPGFQGFESRVSLEDFR